jgi:gluconate 5-dehydrogenase
MTAAGARVVLVGRREAELEAAVRELGPLASYLARDITRFDDATQVIADAERAAGTISIVVHSAGIHLKKPAIETTPGEFQAVLDTHLIGAPALTRAVAPRMAAAGHGSVLFISSMAAFMGVPLVAAYAAAKSAYFGLIATLSAELAPAGVRVNAIAPGWITSPMTEAALGRDPARKAKVMSRIPMGRMGRPDDIGHAAVFLCSPAANYITGTTLCVDGGAAVSF